MDSQSFLIQVELKELAIDNLQRSHNCDQTEVAAGFYPPSLKFRITYEYERDGAYKRKPHTVSLTGSDDIGEVSFGIDVFERPTTELGMCICQHNYYYNLLMVYVY